MTWTTRHDDRLQCSPPLPLTPPPLTEASRSGEGFSATRLLENHPSLPPSLPPLPPQPGALIFNDDTTRTCVCVLHMEDFTRVSLALLQLSRYIPLSLTI